MAPWEHSFWGGQRFKFSDNEIIFPTKPTAVNPLIMSCLSRYLNSQWIILWFTERRRKLDREFKSCNIWIQSTDYFLSNSVFAKTSYVSSKFNDFNILFLTLNKIREFKWSSPMVDRKQFITIFNFESVPWLSFGWAYRKSDKNPI